MPSSQLSGDRRIDTEAAGGIDGYYVLIDLLDRPNLRRNAVAWLGTGLWDVRRDPSRLKSHAVDLGYGILTLIYTIILAYLAIVLFRPTVEGWFDMVAGAEAAWLLAWAVALLFIGLTLAASLAELLRDRLGAETVLTRPDLHPAEASELPCPPQITIGNPP